MIFIVGQDADLSGREHRGARYYLLRLIGFIQSVHVGKSGGYVINKVSGLFFQIDQHHMLI
jgi:hypothetical protein